MSASDPPPLPRLGEVFFDVRGSARSMRLSWYADTGVAVFSIWQASTCTGTFRLPMGELQRMIETLRRGPGGRAPLDDAASAVPPPRALDPWDDAGAAAPPGYPGDHPHGGHYEQGGYPAGFGPLDYTGVHTQAHYLPDGLPDGLPDAAGSGYGPQSARTAAISGSHNGGTAADRGRRGRQADSFRDGQP